ncbi:MAG: LCP family protein [Clostridia bacterium]|nr:LCP family protein [Clostridia bacterium]
MMRIIKAVLAFLTIAALACGLAACGLGRDAVPIVEKPAQDAAAASAGEPLLIGEAAATPAPIYEEETLDEEVFNILLVGTDSRAVGAEAEGLSDSMMLVSYSQRTGVVTLVSFLRDACVKRIGERSYFDGKLNAAFKNGGVGELVNTLNYNFGLDIQNYVCVGYEGFAALVDEIGGLDISLTAQEAYYINWRYADLGQADDKGRRFDELERLGRPALEEDYEGLMEQHLDGGQALWYARDRSSPTAEGQKGSDFTRISRQQVVIQRVFEKIRGAFSIDTAVALISFAQNYVDTNLGLGDMSPLVRKLMRDGASFETARVPFDGSYHYGDAANGESASMIYFNIERTAEELRTLLYG